MRRFPPGDLVDIAGQDVSEVGMSAGQTAVEVMMMVKGTQSTMNNYMVGDINKVEDGDSEYDTLEDTGSTCEMTPLTGGVDREDRGFVTNIQRGMGPHISMVCRI